MELIDKQKLLEWLNKQHFNEASDYEPERAGIYWGVIEQLQSGTFDNHSAQEEIAKLKHDVNDALLLAANHFRAAEKSEARAIQAEQEIARMKEERAHILAAYEARAMQRAQQAEQERDALALTSQTQSEMFRKLELRFRAKCEERNALLDFVRGISKGKYSYSEGFNEARSIIAKIGEPHETT